MRGNLRVCGKSFYRSRRIYGLRNLRRAGNERLYRPLPRWNRHTYKKICRRMALRYIFRRQRLGLAGRRNKNSLEKLTHTQEAALIKRASPYENIHSPMRGVDILAAGGTALHLVSSMTTARSNSVLLHVFAVRKNAGKRHPVKSVKQICKPRSSRSPLLHYSKNIL